MAAKWTEKQRAKFIRTMKAKAKERKASTSNGSVRPKANVPQDFEAALAGLVEVHVRRVLDNLLRGKGL